MPKKENNNSYKELQEKNLPVLTDFFKALGNPTRIHIIKLRAPTIPAPKKAAPEAASLNIL